MVLERAQVLRKAAVGEQEFQVAARRFHFLHDAGKVQGERGAFCKGDATQVVSRSVKLDEGIRSRERVAGDVALAQGQFVVRPADGPGGAVFEAGDLRACRGGGNRSQLARIQPPEGNVAGVGSGLDTHPVRGRSGVVTGIAQRSGLDEDVGGGGRIREVERAVGQRERAGQVVGPVAHRKGARGVDYQAARSANGSGPGGVVTGSVAQLDGGVLGNGEFSRGRVRPGQDELVASLDVEPGRVDDVARIKKIFARAAVVDAVGASPPQGDGFQEFPACLCGGRVTRAEGEDRISLTGVQSACKAGEIAREDGRHRGIDAGARRQAEVGPGFTRQIP